jgi:steroid 5-alpha reductase family enzyme
MMRAVTADLLLNLALVLGVMIALWIVSLRLRDASIVDPVWGMLFVVIAWASLVRRQEPAADSIDLGPVVVALVTIWGVRLSAHLARRNRGAGEDRRYQAMRARFGSRFPLVSLPVVFLLQGVLAWIVALPVQVAVLAPGSAGPISVPLAAAGVALWVVGIVFEAVGDLQLSRFRADPANRGVLDRGLWRYTRHPNYFGDAVVWWGHWLLAAASGAAWTVIGPVLMTVLLRRVSGVTLLERDLVNRRPGYADYVRRTSAFLPRPPHPPDR